MSEHDLEKLLGAFAADTLTPDERRALFTAALQDQQLFNSLADEQALKELLADPDVRRRLLQSLEQRESRSGGGLSWLDWLRKPSGMALAGGLAAAAVAVVLGTKIYQDSFDEAVRSVATEEAKPASPAVDAPTPPLLSRPETEAKSGEQARRAGDAKDTSRDKPAKRKTPTSEQRRRNLRNQEEPGPVRKEDETRHAPAPLAGAAPPSTGARALFYSGAPTSSDVRALSKDTLTAQTEQEPRITEPISKSERFSQMPEVGKAAAPATAKPLGIRYSFVVRGGEGQDREVDAATALRSGGQARLTVETNQDAYLQIATVTGTSAPQLLFPHDAAGHPSIKAVAGTSYDLPLPIPTEGEPASVIVRVSREPAGSIPTGEPARKDRPATVVLEESASPGGPAGLSERAVYVVDTKPSADELIVRIPITHR